MADWAEWVWLNGRLLRGKKAVVSVFDRSFLLGDGLFETMRARGGKIFRLEHHLDRLERGAARLRLSLPWKAPLLENAIEQTLRANELTDAAIRLTVSRGVGPPGVGVENCDKPVGVLSVRSFTGYPDRWYDPGATAIVSRVVKNELSPLCGVKSSSYVEHVLARAEAAERGADEALLLNTRGHLVEGSSSNLFAVIEGILYTPDLRSGCLPGITRATVLEIARTAGLEIRESRLLAAAVPGWDEAFLTSSLLDVAPLVRIDDRPVRSGLPGPITKMLAEQLQTLVLREAAG